jgi:hypothetical protein
MSLPLAPLALGMVAATAPIDPAATEKSRALLLAPMAFSVVAATGNGAANLAAADPKLVWSLSGGGAVTVDLGSDVLIDMVALCYADLPAGATWAINYGDSASGGAGNVLQSPAGFWSAPDAIGPRVHGLFYKQDAPVLARYLSVVIANAGAPERGIGVLCIGQALRFQWGVEWDSTHKVQDRGQRTPLLGGGFGVQVGARVRVKSYPFGDLTDVELRTLDIIEMSRGETEPILVVSDFAPGHGLNERITYGLFESLEDRQRKGVNFARWTLRIAEWR